MELLAIDLESFHKGLVILSPSSTKLDKCDVQQKIPMSSGELIYLCIPAPNLLLEE